MLVSGDANAEGPVRIGIQSTLIQRTMRSPTPIVSLSKQMKAKPKGLRPCQINRLIESEQELENHIGQSDPAKKWNV